jgi:hypothetical protein
MPEAPIHEHSDPAGTVDDVHVDAFDPPIDSEAKSRCMQCRSESTFRPSVAATHARHDLRTGQRFPRRHLGLIPPLNERKIGD